MAFPRITAADRLYSGVYRITVDEFHRLAPGTALSGVFTKSIYTVGKDAFNLDPSPGPSGFIIYGFESMFELYLRLAVEDQRHE